MLLEVDIVYHVLFPLTIELCSRYSRVSSSGAICAVKHVLSRQPKMVLALGP
jgi:hypothetical protein